MVNRKTKSAGKRRREESSPTPSNDANSSVDSSGQAPLTHARQKKRARRTRQPSPTRVLQSALDIVMCGLQPPGSVLQSTLDLVKRGSRPAGSGIAGLSALVLAAGNKDGLNVATKESIRGMKGKGKASTVPKVKSLTSPVSPELHI